MAVSLWLALTVAAAPPLELVRQTDVRGFARALAVHRGGRLVALGTIGPTIALWDAPSAAILRVMEPFGEPPLAVAFAGADGELLLAVRTNGALEGWELASGERRFRGEARAGTRVLAVAPGGLHAATAGGEKIAIWDVDRSVITREHAAGTEVLALAWSPDGATLAAGGDDGSVHVLAPAAEPRVLRGHSGRVAALAFAGAGRLVSGAWDDTARVWDLASGAAHVISTEVPAGEAFAVAESVLSRRWRGHSRALPYRARLAGHVESALTGVLRAGVITSIGEDDSVKRWDAATGAMIGSFGGTFESGQPELLAPDGRTVLNRRSNGVKILWDLSGAEARSLAESEDAFAAAAFSPDGARLLSAGPGGSVASWTLPEGRREWELAAHPKPVRELAVTGTTIATRGDEGKVRVWRRQPAGPPVLAHELSARSYLRTIAVDGTELYAAAVDSVIRWDLESGEMKAEHAGHRSVRRIFVEPGGRHFATFDESRTVRIARTDDGAIVATIEKSSYPMAATPVAFAAGRAWIARDRAPAEMWTLSGKPERRPLPHGPITGFAPAGDGVLGFAADGAVLLLRAEGTLVRKLSAMPSWLAALACTEHLCASAHGDGSVRAFDPAAGRLAWRKKLLGDAGSAVAITGDGQRIAAGGWDGTIALLDARGGVTATTKQGGPIEDLAIEPGGRWIIAGDDGGEVRRWDVTTGAELPGLERRSGGASAAALSAGGCTGVMAVSGEAQVWDLCTARLSFRIAALAGAEVSAVAISGARLAVGDEAGRVRVFELSGAPWFDEKLLDRRVETLAFSLDGARLAAGETAFRDGVRVIELASRTVHRHTEMSGLGSALVWSTDALWWIARNGRLSSWTPPGEPREVTKLEATSQIGFPVYSLAVEGGRLGAAGFMKEARIIDVASGKTMKLRAGAEPAQIFLAKNRVATVDESGAARLWSTAGAKLGELPDVPERPGPPSLAIGFPLLAQVMTPERLLSARWDGVMRVWSLAERRLISAEQESCVPLAVAFAGADKLAAACADGTLLLRKLGTAHTLTFVADRRDWLVYGEDGVFDGSPGGGRLVALRRGAEVFGVDRVALDRNRPDLLFSRFGLGTAEDVAHLERRFRRRRERAGLTGDTADVLDLPQARIAELTRSGRQATLAIQAEDDVRLAALFVRVNGVPVTPPGGRPLQGRRAEARMELALSPGLSEIAVSVTNDRGRESLADAQLLRLEGEARGDLWVLAFGVSRHRDRRLDLKYAHRDAEELAAAFSRARGFRKTRIHVLTDAEVTPKAIAGAAELLRGARPEDSLIVFVAGHGATAGDVDRTYYFLPHGADLADLPGSAVPFSALEDLLASAVPRKRLLLLDTCESGDPDEAAADRAPLPGVRSRGLILADSVRPRRAAHLSERARDRLIYVDLLRRSGATVLSSSRGGELSYESSAERGGLFTRAILKALGDRAADRDADGRLDARELLDYIAPRVEHASGGRQHPSLERENPAERVHLPVAW